MVYSITNRKDNCGCEYKDYMDDNIRPFMISYDFTECIYMCTNIENKKRENK